MRLVVIFPFGTYKKGDEIINSVAINAILTSANALNVVKVASDLPVYLL